MAKISVIMPVYNSGSYLEEAIRSILKQSFTDFEFLIIDDGSTDGSQGVIRSLEDSRIRFIQNEENLGVAATLNKGIDLAVGEYLARMDGDDISAPTRLETQLGLMQKKQQLGVCGSWVKTKNDEGRGHTIRFPLDFETIRAFILFNNPVNHPVVMMRRSLLDRFQLRYDPTCVAAQDYDFWSRCLEHFEFENIQKVLLTWRINKEGMTHRNFQHSNQVAMDVQRRELGRLGLSVDGEKLRFHRSVGNSTGVSTFTHLKRARKWLEQLLLCNDQTGAYPDIGLQKAAALVWFNMCINSSGLGVKVLGEFHKGTFTYRYLPPVDHIVFFLINSILRLRRQPVGGLLGSDEQDNDGR